jgi:hypothetical protein
VDLRDIISASNPLRRTYRRIIAFERVRNASHRHPLPAAAIYFPCGGLGDDLLTTALARLVHNKTGRPVWMLSRHPELFAGNPDIECVVSPTEETAIALARRGVQVVRPVYTKNTEGSDIPPKEHVLTTMARVAKVQGDLELRPRLHVSVHEAEAANTFEGSIVLQSSGLSARFPIRNKEWIPERFVKVASGLSKTAPLVQIGSLADPPIPGTRDLRGRTSVRETAAILARSRLFIGLVGFPMHLARAVDCRAVIIFGGREAPWQSGYSANTNLYRALACAPCWLVDRCDHNKRCMDEISSDDVITAAHEALARPPEQLAVDTIHLGPKEHETGVCFDRPAL